MSINPVNSVPYLRTSRLFPEELGQLTVEINRAYTDTANALNNRTIGIYPKNKPAVTGNTFFLTVGKQQSLRQVYTFGAIAKGTSINIPYTIGEFDQFVQIYGTCKTDQPDSRPIPYASVAANANIDLRIDTPNNRIVISVGAASPNLTSGIIVIEWLSEP